MINCVPEYYREMQEREEREYEFQCRREDGYARDKVILNDAVEKGLTILCVFDCTEHCETCNTRSHTLMTWEDDDIGRFVCYNKNCKYRGEI